MAIEDGHAIHYSAVERGTPVFDSEQTPVGRVEQVVDNYAEHILDGLVIVDNDGVTRFIDGPEVGRTAERGVTLTIDAAAVATHGPPEEGPGVFGANVRQGRLGRLFGRAWRKK